MHPRKRPFSIRNPFSLQKSIFASGLQETEHEEEGEETEVDDQEDDEVSTVSLQKEVKDLSTKRNQVFGAVAKLTKQVSTPRILQEAAGTESVPDSVSGDSFSYDTVVPVYSGERLALCVGEADHNLEFLRNL